MRRPIEPPTRRERSLVSHWPFVAAAYVLVFGVLLAYGWRVERGIRALARPADRR